MKAALRLTLLLALCAIPMRAGAASERDLLIGRLEALLDKHPGEPRVLLRLGIQYVHRADETERPEAIAQARHTLERALDGGAGPEARAWLGLLRCIEAKYGSGPTARAYAQEGLHELDLAVDSAPDNLRFRVMRATVDLRVPREWQRLAQGKEDLLVAEAAVRRDATRLRTYDLDPGELYFKLGQAHLGTGELPEARAAWEKARASTTDPKWTREAARLLRRY